MEMVIEKVCKSYGNVHALEELSLKLCPGIYGILGPNGAGKSTMINLLTDNIKRDSGSIKLNGKDILQMGKEYRELLGYMPQQQICYDGFSAQYFLEYIAALKGMSLKDSKVRNQIEELLKKVNLYDVRSRKVGGFSGGMKRRIILAQALLGNPKILILDEPTAGLDPKERISLRNMIAELSTDKIVLLATHIVSDIECIADYVILMKKGHVIRCAKSGELISEMVGKVAEISCSGEELAILQNKYPASNVFQGADGFVLHVVGDEFPANAQTTDININLEDVYLYHFGIDE